MAAPEARAVRTANDNETMTASEIGVCAAGSVLVVVTVVLRHMGRLILQRRMNEGRGKRGERIWGLDDGKKLALGSDEAREARVLIRVVFNVLAFLSFFGLVSAVSVAIRRGMGVHMDVIRAERGTRGVVAYNQVSGTVASGKDHGNVLTCVKSIYVSAIFYNFTLGMIKLSVLALYQRILRGVQSPMLRTIVWIVFGIVAANTTANVLVAVFQCHPIRAAWDVSLPPTEIR